MSGTWWVYLLRCADGSLYCGVTTDLDRRLAEHKQRQAARSADWGYTGDLGRITEQLAYVLAGLGDASAAEAKGLEY
jgi:predicted GIY-YIG superfamily endonuclease